MSGCLAVDRVSSPQSKVWLKCIFDLCKDKVEVDHFKYLGSVIAANGGVEADVHH